MGSRSTLQVGQVVNRTYEVLRLLGAGYSGEVWEAKHVHLLALVALKIMHAEDRENAHKASRFRAEAAVLFRLRHENIVRILDANETTDGLFFLVMELLTGETLMQRLVKGRLHPLRALKYAYDIACGLDAAHEIGVVHRDVKPDNVFLTAGGVVKIVDFTAAKFFHTPLRTTEPAARVGTLAYMSPEHIEGTTSDARIDQYSLALVIYTMLRGKHPFERYFASQYKLIQAQNNEMPAPLAKVAGLPSWLDDLLAPAFAKQIEGRYATMAELARAIHGALRRLAREMRAGDLTFDVPVGEPPIDVEADSGDRESKRVYLAPDQLVRQTTAPVPPTERVSVAPAALPDAPAEGSTTFDSAATAPLPASRHAVTAPMRRAITTAAVQPTTTTASVRRPSRSPRSRAWIAPAALLLALPAAVGIGWRWKAGPAASTLAVAASPPVITTATPQAPEPPLPAVTAAPSAAAPPSAAASPSSITVARLKPVTTAPRAKPEPIAARAQPEATSASSAPPAPTPPPTAVPSASATTDPHRIFGSEN